jgi:hypothetical protein
MRSNHDVLFNIRLFSCAAPRRVLLNAVTEPHGVYISAAHHSSRGIQVDRGQSESTSLGSFDCFKGFRAILRNETDAARPRIKGDWKTASSCTERLPDLVAQNAPSALSHKMLKQAAITRSDRSLRVDVFGPVVRSNGGLNYDRPFMPVSLDQFVEFVPRTDRHPDALDENRFGPFRHGRIMTDSEYPNKRYRPYTVHRHGQYIAGLASIR